MRTILRVTRCALVVAMAAAVAGCGDDGALPDLPDQLAPDCDALMGVPGAGCGACLDDSQCSGATPRCDRNTGRCVACLPAADNCPKGMRCLPRAGVYACVMSCAAASDCPSGTGGAAPACCNGGCADTATDRANCGSCGNVCAALPNAEPSCKAGVCGLGTCALGWGDCDGDRGNGCEAHIAVDAKNCGACKLTCDGRPNADGACAAGRCTVTCRAGWADCDGDPANGCEAATDRDANNCGACKVVCGPAANAAVSCMAGKCVASCQPGFEDCDKKAANGCETNLNLDVGNCGSCGAACPPVANGAPACRGGVCKLGACSLGFLDCNGMAADGCEASSVGDPANCGACGHLCAGPNSSQACQKSQCAITACAAGWGDCNGKVEDGCEAALDSDPKSCGACGKVCPAPPNAVAACRAGRCAIGGCAPGFADCNLDPVDGCEADLTQPTSCGKCGASCAAPPHGSGACKAMACAVAACDPLWGDCDGNFANGCEKSVAADPANCGACNRACALPNATSGCAAGACTVAACNANYGDCNLAPADGCEASLKADAGNCGKCGNVCPPNLPLCVAGACSAAAKVALIYADTTPNIGATVAAGINNNGQFAGIDLIDATNATPSLQTLSAYRALLVWDSVRFFDRVSLGNALADYADAGGGVVLAEYALFIAGGSNWDLGGRWASGNGGVGYNCIVPGAQALDVLAAKPNDALSPLVQNVKSLSAQAISTGGLVAGAKSVWDYQGGKPAVATCTPGGRKRVDLNFYPNPNSWAGDGYVLMRNALLYVSN